ncbi:hypothetical protein RND71_025323 [Anisodus tanguticus]|uniref:MADS-box domain-containing protein n=1 Tax=Anisodus tanguticus TaxID=243964 RepID=A0AAE1RS28_9SOLA|nr:hypothetical protein RND71_025323 [Anisodus tanguticus]
MRKTAEELLRAQNEWLEAIVPVTRGSKKGKGCQGEVEISGDPKITAKGEVSNKLFKRVVFFKCLAMARKLNGRKRINIAKMQNKSNLDVTFSKRQVGLFKKASELSILCSAEIATISTLKRRHRPIKTFKSLFNVTYINDKQFIKGGHSVSTR